MGANTDAVILGAGPAGVALARLLAARGWSVAVIAARRVDAWEGLSPRVIVGLQRAGCAAAVGAAGDAAPRRAGWNGRTSTLNHEHLVDRARFDAALREDARAAGVRVIEATVGALRRGDRGDWTAFDAHGAPLATAGFLVEARGRRAPATGLTEACGPRTVAVARVFRGPPVPAASAAASFADGWAWMAAAPDGRRLAQIVVDAASVPARNNLSAFHATQLVRVPEAVDWLADATAEGEASARDATAVLRGGLVGADWLRVGDAAFTSDPLSGHGVHSAIGSAFAAVAALTSLRDDPDALPLVRRFVEERSAELFDHAAAVGRAFYRMEERWPDRPFWAARSAWPDDDTDALQPATHGARRQPVIVDGRVVEREVLVTPRLPRGVLTIEGVELAPLLRLAAEHKLASDPSNQDWGATDFATSDFARRVGHPPAPVGVALLWLRQNGFLSGGGLPTG